MNTQLIRSFAMLFGAVIALICAVYVLIGSRRKRKAQQKALQEQSE